jgi:hypothetical protein
MKKKLSDKDIPILRKEISRIKELKKQLSSDPLKTPSDDKPTDWVERFRNAWRRDDAAQYALSTEFHITSGATHVEDQSIRTSGFRGYIGSRISSPAVIFDIESARITRGLFGEGSGGTYRYTIEAIIHSRGYQIGNEFYFFRYRTDTHTYEATIEIERIEQGPEGLIAIMKVIGPLNTTNI